MYEAMPKIKAQIVPVGLVAPSCHDSADDVLFSVEKCLDINRNS